MLNLPLQIDAHPVLALSEAELGVVVSRRVGVGWAICGGVHTLRIAGGAVYCQVMVSALCIEAVESSPRLLLTQAGY